MNASFSLLSLGFLLGMRHAADPDHVLAVSTIVARTKKFGASWLLGALWGLGHTVTIFSVGTAIILLKVVIPPRLGLSMEFAVALALVALGLFNMLGYGPGSEGPAGSRGHTHLPEAELGWLKRLVRDAGAFQLARSLAVGLIHGLAGSAAVALLVLAAIESPRAAVFYLLVFGAGTLAGMLLLSALMELCMLSLTRGWPAAERLLTFATGLLSFSFGLWTAYHLGWVDGLFSAYPHWTPR